MPADDPAAPAASAFSAAASAVSASAAASAVSASAAASAVSASAAASAASTSVDFSALYDQHPEYVARRASGSFEQAQIDIEVRLFKLPQLMGLLAPGHLLTSVLEIGCATGELIAAVPVRAGGRKVGMDISSANVAAARSRFPDVDFRCGDFRLGDSDAGYFSDARAPLFDAVIMSDVLEHVPDDESFLRDAAALGDTVLVNLPIEDNWLNRNRAYGPDDVSGHLRRYTLADGLALFERAGLEVTAFAQVWVHETATEPARRALRLERQGAQYSGAWPQRAMKKAVFAAATAVPAMGRRLFASNLFAAARRRSAA